jgi:hypothetical protein
MEKYQLRDEDSRNLSHRIILRLMEKDLTAQEAYSQVFENRNFDPPLWSCYQYACQ